MRLGLLSAVALAALLLASGCGSSLPRTTVNLPAVHVSSVHCRFSADSTVGAAEQTVYCWIQPRGTTPTVAVRRQEFRCLRVLQRAVALRGWRPWMRRFERGVCHVRR